MRKKKRKVHSRRKPHNEFYYIIAGFVVLSLGFGFLFVNPQQPTGSTADTIGEIQVPEKIKKEEIKTLPDGTKYLVHPNLILSGGPPKGGIGVDVGIPAIADPKFETVEEATWLADDELVFGIFVDGMARAYPKQILVYHEIVNDKINDMSLLVTYCPLCGTGIAFERKLPTGEEANFGTSGKLYNSNLVMYDDKTDTYWTQVGGKAIIGEFTGNKLKQVPMDTMLYGDWKKLHSGTQVLSKDTGLERCPLRCYGTDPYGDYYSSLGVGFGVDFNDNRLHPKAMVSGVNIDRITKAYPVKDLDKVNVVNDEVNEMHLLVVKDPEIDVGEGFEINPIRIFDRNVDGSILNFEIKEGKIFDKESGSEWSFEGEAVDGEFKGKKLDRIDGESSMWFAWLAFNPDTALFST